ncbi:MAG TPA: hypothetical protein VGB77_07875 [Abditibacteriaceae bacterium]|jgi:Na+-translocating ferredoxin:NAD+ oxidoreductase RnfG subunit
MAEVEVFAALAGAVIAGIFALIANDIGQDREQNRQKTEWFREKLIEAYS